MSAEINKSYPRTQIPCLQHEIYNTVISQKIRAKSLFLFNIKIKSMIQWALCKYLTFKTKYNSNPIADQGTYAEAIRYISSFDRPALLAFVQKIIRITCIRNKIQCVIYKRSCSKRKLHNASVFP